MKKEDIIENIKLQLSKNGFVINNLITYGLEIKNLPNHYKIVKQTKNKIKINKFNSPYECLLNLIIDNPELNNKYAIIQDRKITYRQMMDEIDQLANYMHYILNCKKGENISICAASSIEGIISFFAMNKLGLVNARIFNGSMSKKLQDNLINFDSTTIFIDENNLYELSKIVDNTKIKNVIMMSKCSEETIKEFKNNHNNISLITWEDIKHSMYNNNYIEDVTNDDMASILYTSGSSGEPKPISISNRVYTSMVNIVCNTTNIKKCDSERVVGVVSHEYPYAAINSTIMILLMGKTLVMPLQDKNGNLDFKKLFDNNPDRVQAIPNFYKLLESSIINDNLNRKKVAHLNSIVSGGETFLRQEKMDMLKNIKKEVKSNPLLIDGFGFGELGSATALKFGLNDYFMLMNGIEAKAIDPETHDDLPIEQEGILCFSGPTIAENYYNNEKATKNSFVYDENGKKWFVSDTYGLVHGRLKRLIKLGGRIREYFITGDGNGNFVKVYAGSVEDVISACGLVKDCVVVPSGSDAMPKPVAYISLREDCNYSDQDVINMVLSKCNSLENFARPCEIKIENEIERTTAGKKNYMYYKEKQLCKKRI